MQSRVSWSRVALVVVIVTLALATPVVAAVHHAWVSLATWVGAAVVTGAVLLWLHRRGLLRRWLSLGSEDN